MHHITSQLYIFNKFLVIKNIEAIKKLNIMKALYIYNTYQSTCEIGSKTVLEYYLDDIVDCFFFLFCFFPFGCLITFTRRYILSFVFVLAN